MKPDHNRDSQKIDSFKTMNLKSLDGCILAIGSYPLFHYNATGGGGKASIVNNAKDKINILFDKKEFFIPSLNWKTTKVLGIPIPPGLEIKMKLDKLEGSADLKTGAINLNFEARFLFTIFTFKFPNLVVITTLSTNSIKSNLHSAKGLPLNENNESRLVGIAVIPPSGNKALDLFLGLPNEALAVLSCKINFS